MLVSAVAVAVAFAAGVVLSQKIKDWVNDKIAKIKAKV